MFSLARQSAASLFIVRNAAAPDAEQAEIPSEFKVGVGEKSRGFCQISIPEEKIYRVDEIYLNSTWDSLGIGDPVLPVVNLLLPKSLFQLLKGLKGQKCLGFSLYAERTFSWQSKNPLGCSKCH